MTLNDICHPFDITSDIINQRFFNLIFPLLCKKCLFYTVVSTCIHISLSHNLGEKCEDPGSTHFETDGEWWNEFQPEMFIFWVFDAEGWGLSIGFVCDNTTVVGVYRINQDITYRQRSLAPWFILIITDKCSSSGSQNVSVGTRIFTIVKRCMNPSQSPSWLFCVDLNDMTCA